VLEIAGLESAPPEMVRANPAANVPLGIAVDAGNPSRPPGLNAITAFPIDPSVLATLNSIAFISAREDKKAGPIATRLDDPEADSFLYAMSASIVKGATQPDTLFLFYDTPRRTSRNFRKGQIAAKVSLPLTALNGDGVTERAVSAILQYKPSDTGNAPCSASTVSGSFSGSRMQTLSAAAIGVNCALVFGASPTSPHPHAILELSVPLLVTATTDPAYFSTSPVSLALPNALSSDNPGFTPAAGVLGVNWKSIGVAPTAAPLGGPPTSGPATYALCADLPEQEDGQELAPAVAVFYAIATDGETLVSSPRAPSPLANGKPSIVCPAGM
jgi:hypothetical protein